MKSGAAKSFTRSAEWGKCQILGDHDSSSAPEALGAATARILLATAIGGAAFVRMLS